MYEAKQIAEWYGLYLEWGVENQCYVVGDYQGNWKYLPKGFSRAALKAVCVKLNPFAD